MRPCAVPPALLAFTRAEVIRRLHRAYFCRRLQGSRAVSIPGPAEFAQRYRARPIDTIKRQALPGVDPEAEAQWITEAELNDVEGVVAIPGAVAFLSGVPGDQWGLVTSAPRELALRRLQAAGISPPAVWVTAEDVDNGKPDPACYVLAAQRLGVAAQDCLVFEDATVGIRAGEAAGADVMVVTSTHLTLMVTAHASIDGYEQFQVQRDAEGLLRVERRMD